MDQEGRRGFGKERRAMLCLRRGTSICRSLMMAVNFTDHPPEKNQIQL
jgi:hypothetical protein